MVSHILSHISSWSFPGSRRFSQFLYFFVHAFFPCLKLFSLFSSFFTFSYFFTFYFLFPAFLFDFCVSMFFSRVSMFFSCKNVFLACLCNKLNFCVMLLKSRTAKTFAALRLVVVVRTTRSFLSINKFLKRFYKVLQKCKLRKETRHQVSAPPTISSG